MYGSYPETVTIDDKEKYLLNLTADYLLRDVLYSGLVKSPETIKRLLALLAYQAGNEVDLIIKGSDTFKAYEIKWTKVTPTPSIRAFTNNYGVPVDVITKDNVIELLWGIWAP
jgi:predicted AAA+ superfamily ATPase